MPANLTTVDRVKAWGSFTGDPVLIRRLIQSASAFVRSALPNIALDYGQVTEVYDGGGGTFMLLRQRPAVSVLSIGLMGIDTPITQEAQFSPFRAGYQLEGEQPPGIPNTLWLHGYNFLRGRGNVRVTYMAGYVTEQADTIPDAQPFEICPWEMWLSDIGVTLADGTALVKVKSDPAAGQYAIDNGVYQFNSADGGKDIVIRYNYCPADICQAVTELVGERLKAKDRIGISGQGVGGRENVQYFSQRDMNSYTKAALMAYTSSIPV